METQRASLSLGHWPLWLLLLGLAVPWASAQALSYREAVLRAVDRLNEQSSDPNLYRLLELDLPPKADENPDAPKPVSFTVKETVCPRSTQQPTEQCAFKENGLVKQCVGTVTLDQSKDQKDITCDKARRFRPLPFLPPRIPRQRFPAPNFPPPNFPPPRFPPPNFPPPNFPPPNFPPPEFPLPNFPLPNFPPPNFPPPRFPPPNFPPPNFPPPNFPPPEFPLPNFPPPNFPPPEFPLPNFPPPI
ncbi:protegrin-2-like [Camelus bactrianus]